MWAEVDDLSLTGNLDRGVETSCIQKSSPSAQGRAAKGVCVLEIFNLMKWVMLVGVLILVSACGGPAWDETSSASTDGPGSQTTDRDRILALQDKGGSFSVLPCTAMNRRTGKEEPCEYDRERWKSVGDADLLRWEECIFEKHGLGGYVSLVTIVLDGESWHTIYVYDKNVC